MQIIFILYHKIQVHLQKSDQSRSRNSVITFIIKFCCNIIAVCKLALSKINFPHDYVSPWKSMNQITDITYTVFLISQ